MAALWLRNEWAVHVHKGKLAKMAMKEDLISLLGWIFLLAFVAQISISKLLFLSVCTRVSAEDALMFETVSSANIIRAQRNSIGNITPPTEFKLSA